MRTIDQLAQALDAGQTSSRALVEDSLTRIADPSGEGARVFIKVHAEQARRDAVAAHESDEAGVAEHRAPVLARRLEGRVRIALGRGLVRKVDVEAVTYHVATAP